MRTPRFSLGRFSYLIAVISLWFLSFFIPVLLADLRIDLWPAPVNAVSGAALICWISIATGLIGLRLRSMNRSILLALAPASVLFVAFGIFKLMDMDLLPSGHELDEAIPLLFGFLVFVSCQIGVVFPAEKQP